ncbi:MAG: DUF1553 domain-containing protein [Gemmata sp.]
MPHSRLPTALLVIVVTAEPGRAAPPDFDRSVLPILASRCLQCHAGEDAKGGLDLTRHKTAGKAFVPGKPDESGLWKRVASHEMPPKKPLSDAERAVLKSWIEGGAKWGTDPIDPFAITTSSRAGRDWWSLQPIVRPAAPAAGSPVDAFIRNRLAEAKMRPAPVADRRTLVRRVYYDLLGLPPRYEEVEAFVKDDRPDAYEKLIDKLLASPHYGERWGRYWLDAVRYAETCGYERDQVKPDVWKYRDWVIRAFNDDLPFGRFVQEQLAGDELPDATERSVIATGFIRLGTWNDEPNDPREYQYDRLEDMVGTTTTAFLALTVRCARCHDHKFDPISQQDYYRVGAAFWAGHVQPGSALGGPDAKALGHANVFGWTDKARTAPPLHLLKKGDPNRPGPVVEPGHLSAVPSLDKPLAVPPERAKTTTRRLQLANWIVDPKNPLAARVWVNRLWQGHFGSGLVRTPDNFGFTGEKPTHPELLDWLAAEFLANGGRTKPLHRLILLSDTYRQSSVHPQQEQYAKADASNRMWWRAERRRLDAEALRDSLLAAAGNLKTEKIGGPSFAPVIPPDALEGLSTKAAAWKPSPPEEQGRRAVYVFAKRGLLPPLLTTFDLPDTTLPNCRRDVTTVPTQALALLNNPFVHEQSAALAARIGPKRGQIELATAAWRLALARDPRPTELRAAVAHLEKQAIAFAGHADPAQKTLASLCHVLLNTNEFVYVD